jgi:UDP-N-acetylglucosamine 2-epimerase (non-hydrolysing)
MLHVLHVVGTRPNFVKMAPVIDALRSHPAISQTVVHSGQHYDRRMSAEIIDDLGFPAPDVFLDAGSGTHGEQTARVLASVEQMLIDRRPDLVCVGGDVNSTLAAALAATKLGIPMAHVESGLRSFDWSMPEEVNRVLTDRMSELLFIHSPEAVEHLAAEGIDLRRVHFVGNTMIDSLRRLESVARARRPWEAIGVQEREYVLATLHRPSNVDSLAQLRRIVAALAALARRTPVVLPMHPRAHARLEQAGLLAPLERAGVGCTAPMGYLDFLGSEIGAGAIVTDSGGVQEEASVLGVPCYTLRPNTERPITITRGTNTLLGEDPAAIATIELERGPRHPQPIHGWDGHAGERIAAVIAGIAEPERSDDGGTGVPRERGRRFVRHAADRRPAGVATAHAESARGGRAQLLGTAIDRLEMDEVVARCERSIDARAPIQHVAVNAAKVVAMQQDQSLRRIVNRCELITADGQSVVWASHLLGDPLPSRVTGIDLMGQLFELAERRRYRVYVLGGRAEVLDAAVERLWREHPALELAGYRDGYFSADEEAAVAAQIRRARPDMLFVAMPTPRKEYFLARWGDELDVPFTMGVGGAIDVLAGVTRRAPAVLQRLGLEWAFRLAQEPRRLFRRYLVTNSRFVLLTLRQAVRGTPGRSGS